jgi:hypothetical protein
MLNDPSGFCTSLQLNWSLDEVTFKKGSVTVRLSAGSGVGYPDPLGRPGQVVVAEPHVFIEEQSAEIDFKSVIWWQLVDEYSFATAAPASSEVADQFDGSQFRIYSRSDLLTRLRQARTTEVAARLKHYQLITSDEVLDIVTTEAPVAVIRNVGSR